MNRISRSCRRYRELADELVDRDLTPREASFYDLHHAACSDCREYEVQGALALNMLRDFAEVETDDSSRLTERIVRKARLQNIRGSFRYWMPALGGMAIGALMMMAVLQLVGQSDILPRNANDHGDARRIEQSNTVFPELRLK